MYSAVSASTGYLLLVGSVLTLLAIRDYRTSIIPRIVWLPIGGVALVRTVVAPTWLALVGLAVSIPVALLIYYSGWGLADVWLVLVAPLLVPEIWIVVLLTSLVVGAVYGAIRLAVAGSSAQPFFVSVAAAYWLVVLALIVQG